MRRKTTFTHNLNICRTFKLTPSGKKAADTHTLNSKRKLLTDLSFYIDKFKTATPSQILKHVYEEYPDMTINSVLLTPDDDV